MRDQRIIGWPITIASWVVLLLAGVIGLAPLIPPEVPDDPGPAEFSTTRALDLIGQIAFEPHPIGTAANERVRATIIGELRALGLEPELQAIDAPDYYGGSGGLVPVVNVLARISGTDPTAAVAIVGHYDTVPATPGANDDASAIAVMLETARAVLAGDALRNDLILVFTDGEEPAPRFGSSAFVDTHPWARQIGTVVNLETIGGTGPSTLIGVSGPDGWIVDQYARTAPYPVAFSYVTALTRLIGGSNSDFAEFRDQGIPGIELAYIHGSSIYHTPADTPDQVNPGSLQQQGANTLAFARSLAALDLGAERGPGETVFFTLGRFLVVRYPVQGELIVVLLAGFALAVAGWRRRNAGAGSIRWSLARSGIVVILSPLLAAMAWTNIATGRSTMGVGESYLYLACLVAMTAGIAIVLGRLFRRRDEPDPVAVVAIWWVLALLTAATAPGLSYLFGWPAMAGALVLLWRSRSRGRARHWEELAGFALVVGVTLVLLVPAIDTFYQLVQPRPGNPDSQMLAIVVVPVVLIALVVELLRAFWARDAIRGDARSPVPSR